jgi:hypothetical protein
MKQAECRGIPLSKVILMKGGLDGVHFQNLTLAIGSAVRACDMGGNAAFALRACFELGNSPAVRAATHFLLHLGCSALGYSHGISWLRC